MQKQILQTAKRKIKELSANYDGFINITVDDWRGFRFIFDTKDVRQCKNNCSNCRLYQLLKNEKNNQLFSTGLYPAKPEDKKIFGRQNFLNCKTLNQYANCYINFILKITRTKKEIFNELSLIENSKLIFSKNENAKKIENKFKQKIIKTILKKSPANKKRIILEYLKTRLHKAEPY